MRERKEGRRGLACHFTLFRNRPQLDHNGWRMFVSGCVYTMTSGKGPQRCNAEVMLVETVRRWRDQVVDLLPERAVDLRRIVEAGLDRPEPPPHKEG